MPVLAAEGDSAGLADDLSALAGVPRRAQAPSLLSLLAQADPTTVEVVVNTEEELLAAAKVATEQTIIVLGDDIELQKDPLMADRGQSYTLDLNGYTLSRKLDEPTYMGCVIYINLYGSLSIANASILQGTITGGNTVGSGGAIVNYGTLFMKGGKIAGNHATSYGGGVANFGTATLRGISIESNDAGLYGGGIYNSTEGELTLDGGTIAYNSADLGGGGVYNGRHAHACSIVGCTITRNKAKNGGGIYDVSHSVGGDDANEKATLSISGVTLTYNTASERGGGLYASLSSYDDDGIIRVPPLDIDAATKITNNEAGAEGGGIYFGDSYRAAITNALVKSNISGVDGGGIYVDGTDIGGIRMENYVIVKDNKLKKEVQGTQDGKPNNLRFASPDNVISVTGPFHKDSRIYVTFDPSLYRKVTMDYSENAVATDADGNEAVVDPIGTFFSEGNHVAFLKDGEVRIAMRIPYVDENDVPHEIIDYEEVTNSFEGGKGQALWFVAPDGVTIAGRPDFTKKSNLIILDGAKLTCTEGLNVPKDSSLTIYGQEKQSGIIVADARNLYAYAGIGSGDSLEAGRITINGANVYAYGGNQGAGIGCGGLWPLYGHDHSQSDPFTLNRGYVEATGGNSGAGVGHGLSDFTYSGGNRIVAGWSSDYDMFIHGGTLIAKGGDKGPGIGVSANAGFTLYVDGGEVVATGGYLGAGIGSADEFICYDESDLTFAGGKVTAIGGANMPGIGCLEENYGGYYDRGNQISFTGGILEYTKGSGASKPLDGLYDASTTGDTMVLAGTSADDAQRVPAEKRWDTLRDSQYSYVRVEPCDHYGAEVNPYAWMYKLECPWCRDEMLDGWPIHYEPGEGSGEMADGFMEYRGTTNTEFTLPTKTTFVPPRAKELSGWKIGDTVYAPGDTINVKGSVTAVAQWKMTWASVQKILNASEPADDTLVLEVDLVARESDRALTVPAGKSVELDLNGHKIDRSLSEPTPRGSAIRVEGSLTVKGDGIITGGNNSTTGDYGGGGVSVAKGASFTMRNATISGNNAAGGAGVYTQGDFLLESGTISQNVIDGKTLWGNGGGVMVDGGTFTMCPEAIIKGNSSPVDGGGVMLQSGTFLLGGGTISGNTAKAAGAGVFVGSQGTMRLGGSPHVSGNTIGKRASNVLLQDPALSLINIEGLDDSAEVGVTTEQEPFEGNPVTITSGLGDKDLVACFTSDDRTCTVDFNDKGEAILGLPAVVSFDPGEVGTGEMAPVTKASGNFYEIPACSFRAKNGQKFLGWQMGDVTVSPGESVVVSRDFTLTALWAEDYGVWVGDTLVTKDNKDDILDDGTVSFDPATNTLTLDGFAGLTSSTDRPVIYSKGVDLTVTGSGHISLRNSSASCGIQAQDGSLRVGGDLEIAGELYGIHAEGDVTFTHGELAVFADIESGTGVYVEGPDASITVARDVTLLEVSARERAFYTGDVLSVTLEDDLTIKEPEDESLAGEHVLIVHADQPAVATVVAREGLVYDGSDQELVSYEVEGGTVLFGLSHEGPFGEAATARDAGTYQVYYRVKGDADHDNVPIKGPVEVTIAKAVPEFTVTAQLTDNTLDVAAVSLQKEGGPDGTLTLDETELMYGTHEYHWTFVPDDTNNYTEATGTVQITVDEWGAPTYEWSPGMATVTARRVNRADPSIVETEVAPVTSQNTKEPTCTEWGEITYTATFQNPAFETQTRTSESQRPTGHEPGETVIIWYVEPTCTRGGNGRKQIICKKCGEVADWHNVHVDALGHDWDDPSYEWSTDNTVCMATRTCKRDGSHKESEAVNAAYEMTAEPTCTERGEATYTADFESDVFDTQTKTVVLDALGHDWQTIATSTGGTVHVKKTCTRCDTVEEYDYEEEGHVHEMGIVRAVEPSCTEPGTRLHYLCVSCQRLFADMAGNVELQPSDVIDPAIGHDWQEPTYEWSEDNSSVVATRACAHDASHIETEAARTTSRTTKEASCNKAGEVIYTAVFENPAFVSQTKTAEVDPLGHVPAEAVIQNEVEAGCEEPGSYDAVTYCSVCEAEIDRTTVHTAAKGHDWDNGTITVRPSYTTEGVRTYTCKRVASHTRTEPIERLDPGDQGALLAQVFGHSLTLDGRIAMNTYLVLGDAILANPENYRGEYWYDGEMVESILVSEAATGKKTVDGKEYTVYKFPVTSVAKDADAEFAFKIHDLEGGTYLDFASSDGKSTIAGEEGLAYSIVDYLDDRIQNSESTEMKQLARDLRAYHVYAKHYFDVRDHGSTEALPTAPEGFREVVASDLEDYAYDAPGSIAHFSYRGTTLDLLTDTSFRLCFSTDDVSKLAITCGGEQMAPVKNGGMYYVEVKGIAAQDVDDMYDIEVSNGSETAAAHHGPLGYARWALSTDAAGSAQREALQRAMMGLYRYNRSAEAYFAH